MIKKINRKQCTKVEYLPCKLVEKYNVDIVNQSYEYRTINNFIQCISIIYYHQVTNGIGLNDYVPLGSKYWKKLYGGNYYQRVIEPLLEIQIIESFDFGYRTFPNSSTNKKIGNPNGKVGIRYRINPDLLGNEFTSIPYIEKGKVLTAMERMHRDEIQFTTNGIPDLNFRISIDQDKVNDWIDGNAESIINNYMNIDFINDLPEKLSIQYKQYSDNGSFNTKYSSVKAAKIVASSRGKELFYYKESFYIADVEFFISQRIPALIHHYKRQISQIGSMPIEEQRNELTLRIYSHLTNIPSNILQFIKINNKTVFQLDLRTSQFLIFANLLNVYITKGEKHLLSLFKQKRTLTYLKRLIKILDVYKNQLPTFGIDINNINSGNHSSSDVIKFIRDVFYADFYSVVQDEMRFKKRILAKYLVFKLLFKKTNRPDKLLNKLNVRYPVLMDIIAGFKTQEKSKIKSGNNDDRESNFSVFLQCVEGEIYVDNVLKILRENNIPCFTRHDSIVVASGYEKEAEQIIKSVFNDFGFKYNHKVEDKFWEVVDYDELEQSDYFQYLIDETELEQDFYYDESDEDSIENESEDIYDLDEEHFEIIERLMDIGIKDDYFEYVDADFLEDLVLLPFLNEQQRNVLYDDINNLHDAMSYFQEETNELIQQIILFYSDVRFHQ